MNTYANVKSWLASFMQIYLDCSFAQSQALHTRVWIPFTIIYSKSIENGVISVRRYDNIEGKAQNINIHNTPKHCTGENDRLEWS